MTQHPCVRVCVCSDWTVFIRIYGNACQGNAAYTQYLYLCIMNQCTVGRLGVSGGHKKTCTLKQKDNNNFSTFYTARVAKRLRNRVRVPLPTLLINKLHITYRITVTNRVHIKIAWKWKTPTRNAQLGPGTDTHNPKHTHTHTAGPGPKPGPYLT